MTSHFEEHEMRLIASKTLILSLAAACLIAFGCDSQPAGGTKTGATTGGGGGGAGADESKPIKKGKAAKTTTGPSILKED
jgi:hypothetical protein